MISKLFEYGAWPVAALGIVCLLRTQLQELLQSIKTLEAGPVKLELERVAKEVEEAKQVAQAADAKASVVVAKFDETEDQTEQSIEASTAVAQKSKGTQMPLSEVESKVLKAMVNSRFVTRSVSGVAKDTDLSKAAVQSTYGALIAKRLVEQTKNNEGNPRWVVTALGRAIANEA